MAIATCLTVEEVARHLTLGTVGSRFTNWRETAALPLTKTGVFGASMLRNWMHG